MMLCRVRRQNSPDIGAMDAEAAGDLGIGEPVSFETADLSHLDAHRGFAAFVFTFGLGRRNPFALMGVNRPTTIPTRTPTMPTTRLATKAQRSAHGFLADPERLPMAIFNPPGGFGFLVRDPTFDIVALRVLQTGHE
jgi:hypothetical protein